MRFKEYRPALKVLLPFVILYWIGVGWEAFDRGGSFALYYVSKPPDNFWILSSITIVLGLLIGMGTLKHVITRWALSFAFFVSSFRSILIAMSFLRAPHMVSKAAIPAVALITTLHWVMARTSLKLPTEIREHPPYEQ